ncbi:sigma-54 interaction domain-containing protein [Shouchella sp. JSM 1781072]|uniref:sigma-54 interaction domain-containing protein n=1 Tax=Bacillaceae TaxID=186817 RepID=UPI000C071320|nr:MULTISPECIES: sigma 54-interacting transcriptional regulator [Bacillaceae]UTR05330.1 sigma 54-interacting transcriptional regulator [Alkalihalobacillus sp. LMS6]
MKEIDIHKLPFPSFLTNEQGELLTYNRLFEKKFHYLIGDTDWKRHALGGEDGDQIKLVYLDSNDEHFLFLKEESSNEPDQLYVGIRATSVHPLFQQLKEAEHVNRELNTIIENSYDGIYITDANGTTLKANKAIERITGIPPSYYLGKNVDSLVERGILENSVTHKVRAQKRVVSVVQKNFEGKETLFTGTPVFDQDGQLEKVVTNIRDLSELNDLQKALRKATELNQSYKVALDKLKHKRQSDDVVVMSQKMKTIYQMAERIADVDATVLILGETGVGKDVLAKHIFNQSYRAKEGKFIKVNCGAIPPELLESELFGYEKGAFTGASNRGKVGMFELAHKGMLFLDEVGELPIHLQVKLLRVLQEGEIQRIGGTQPKKVRVRVVAATNRKLQEMVDQGTFREDLFYRLNVIPIHIPPLRERTDDIVSLVNLFLNQLNEKYGLHKTMDQSLKQFFIQHRWKGNVRELSNLVERMLLTTEEPVMGLAHLPSEYTLANEAKDTNTVSLKSVIEQAEEKIMRQAAEQYGSTYEIAEALKTSQPTVVRKLKKYNLSVNQFQHTKASL